MTNDTNPKYDLEERTAKFGEDIIKNQPLDKVKPYYIQDRLCLAEEIVKLRADTLYLVTYGNLPMDFREKDKNQIPTGLKLIDVIKYPDNEVAFYLLTRDSKDGLPVQPDKPSYCK